MHLSGGKTGVTLDSWWYQGGWQDPKNRKPQLKITQHRRYFHQKYLPSFYSIRPPRKFTKSIRALNIKSGIINVHVLDSFIGLYASPV